MDIRRLALSALFIGLAVSGTGAEEWLPVKENNLEISAGSPLDFSGFLANTPIEEKSPDRKSLWAFRSG